MAKNTIDPLEILASNDTKYTRLAKLVLTLSHAGIPANVFNNEVVMRLDEEQATALVKKLSS